MKIAHISASKFSKKGENYASNQYRVQAQPTRKQKKSGQSQQKKGKDGFRTLLKENNELRYLFYIYNSVFIILQLQL